MSIKQCSVVLLCVSLWWLCASAAVHKHALGSPERESDGSYRSRASDHYGDSGHNSEFDHEAILGSVKEAELFEHLNPSEAKQRLASLLPKMDLNGDDNVDRIELRKWILKSFINLSREEAEERLQEADEDHDGVITWEEYLQESLGVDREDTLSLDEMEYSGNFLQLEREMWKKADRNGDSMLDLSEFEVFTNPEEHDSMHPYLINQTLREKDTDGDGRIDFIEFIGDRASTLSETLLETEKERFDLELDLDGDGWLDLNEIHQWVIPNNEEIAEEEVDHLFASADDDQDDLLSYEEFMRHFRVFVGSEAARPGDIFRDHYVDEL